MKSGETITITKLPGTVDLYKISNLETNEHDIGGGVMVAVKLAQLTLNVLTPSMWKPGVGAYQLVYDDIRKQHPELPKLLLMEDESRN